MRQSSNFHRSSCSGMTTKNTSSNEGLAQAGRVVTPLRHDSFMLIKPHPDFPHYLVSTHGDVYGTLDTHRNPRATPMKLRPNYIGDEGRKYPTVTICHDGIKELKLVHCLVLETFVGPCPYGHEGAHNNGITTDAQLVNLRWATPQENWADRKKHGRGNAGTKNPAVKLTDEKVMEIRFRRNAGCLQRVLSSEFGISQSTVSLIVLGRKWRHLLPIQP